MTKLFEGTINVLLVEDEAFDVRRVRSTIAPFEEQIHIVEVVSNGDRALEILAERKGKIDVMVMDMQIAGGVKGEALIRAARRISPALQIIVITKMTVNVTDYGFANRLLEAGAYWYCTKYPTDVEEYIYQPTDFILSIINAYQRKVLEREQSRSERKLLRNVEATLARYRILGISGSIQKLRGQIKQLAVTDATVLISGASGTGKEVVATNIHFESQRRFENFVPLNCGGIPDDLIESELFGFEKGAFTGAHAAKRGFFEQANHGTIFLDEIAELPLQAQVKLLRVIQEGEIQKIGSTERKKVDVRILAATNKLLHQEVAAGRFREDLYYRLNVVPIHIPSLRERPEDIPVLWEHFMRQSSIDMGRPFTTTDEETLALLTAYRWPGNVREIKNVVQRLLLRDEAVVTAAVIREVLQLGGTPPGAAEDVVQFPPMNDLVTLNDLEREVRKKYVAFVRRHSGSDADAATKLGLAPSNFHRMAKDLGLKR